MIVLGDRRRSRSETCRKTFRFLAASKSSTPQ